MTTQALIEREDYSEAVADTDARVLRGVVLIRAGLSKNGREYSETVLQTAAPLFNNVKAYANHGDPKSAVARSIRDTTGWYENARYDSGKLIADRHFTPNEAGEDAWKIAEAIASGRAPKTLAGLSINALGQGKSVKRDTGVVLEVQSIDRALSVDDVSDAAAGGSYVENEGNNLTSSLLELITFEEWFAARPEFIKRVQNEMKTVRQDDALTAAKAEAEQARQALKEAQDQLTAALAASEAAVLEAATARRERDIERVLPTANVPKDWLTSLREQLMNAASEQWAGIIESEQSKAKAAGHKVAVTGAGQQVHVPTVIKESSAPKPLDMTKFKSPEEFAAFISQTRNYPQ